MSHMLELSETKSEIVVIAMLKAPVEKMDHIHKQMRNFSSLLKNKSQMNMLKTKKTHI